MDKKTPKFRFKGFSDTWEQRKFGSILKEIRDKTIVEDQDTLLSCAIDGMYLNSELFSHFRGSSNIGYLKIKKNDLILSAQNLHLGNCNVNLRFDHGIISPAYKVFELVNCDPLFMHAWVKQEATKNFFLKASTEGASVCRKNIVWEDLYKQELPLPNIKEQEKIGSFFSHFDNIITLHQRKLDKLSSLKKAYLEKMFPKKGKLYPELRFAGFTDAWEQRKLGEVLSFLKDGTHGTHADANDGPLLLSAKNIKDGAIKWAESDRRISREEYEKIHAKFSLMPGDVLLTIVGSIGETAILKDVEGLTFQRSVAFLRPNNEISSEFLYSEIQTPAFQKELDSRKSTSAQPGIYLGDLAEIPINYSPSLEEQKKIGEYFRHLDNLITLHQRKLDKLKQIKSGYLNSMFI